MTSETAQTFADAFLEHREAFGVSATIGTDPEISVLANESQFGRELKDGGFAQEGDVEMKYLLADLTTQPELGTAATYRARSFKVKQISTQPGALVGEILIRPAKR